MRAMVRIILFFFFLVVASINFLTIKKMLGVWHTWVPATLHGIAQFMNLSLKSSANHLQPCLLVRLKRVGHAEGSGNVYFGLSLVRTLHFQILNCYKLKIHRINTSLGIEKVLTVFSIFEKIFSKINSLMAHINRTLFLHGHIQRSFVTCLTDWPVLQVTHGHIFFFLFVCVNID